MAVVISPDSELGRELVKHEQHRTKYVPDEAVPGNPYLFRLYPKMLYRAQRRANGQVRCLIEAPNPFGFPDVLSYERALLEVDSFNSSCQRIVTSADAEALARGQGWCESIQDAVTQAEREAQAIGNAAAEAAYQAQRMTEQARAEYQAADAATEHHVVDVVPARKRGRPFGAKGVAVKPAGGTVED